MQQVYNESSTEFINIASVLMRLNVEDSISFDHVVAGDNEKKLLMLQGELNRAFIFATKLSSKVSAQLTEEFGFIVLIAPSAIGLGSWDIREHISIDGKQLRTAILAAWMSTFIPGGGDLPDPPNPPVPTEEQIEFLQERICNCIEYRYKKIIEEENKITIEELIIERKKSKEVRSDFIQRFEI